MNYIYEVNTDKPFEDTVRSVEENTKTNGFRVLHVHDVQATLAEKDIKHGPLKIIEVCNAKYAYSALQIEITVSLMMPCRINVYNVNGKTVISTVRPKFLLEMFNKQELQSFANEVEDVLKKIIDESK